MHLFALIAQDGESSGSPLSFLILLLLPVLMYFLLIRPQRKRMKQQAALQSEIGQGDEVITTSGIYGFISAVEDDFFWLEIDRDEDDRAVQIRIAKAAVQGKVSPKQEADEAAPSDAEQS